MRNLEWIVYGVFSGVVLFAFLLFVALGWPGEPNNCISEVPHACYCESFDAAKVEANRGGVRQPWNTWSNLYALGTGAFLAWQMSLQRRRREANPEAFVGDENRMRTSNVFPMVYLCCVVFLGLGSMWFHASLAAWGGLFDQFSMFTLVAFLYAYTVVRLTNSDLAFYASYPLMVGLLTALGAIGAPSTILIAWMAGAGYFALELVAWIGRKDIRHDWKQVLTWWLPALAAFGLAALFRGLSVVEGDPLCFPDGFQFHAVWHWLAGVMAVLLYFYWRVCPR